MAGTCAHSAHATPSWLHLVTWSPQGNDFIASAAPQLMIEPQTMPTPAAEPESAPEVPQESEQKPEQAAPSAPARLSNEEVCEAIMSSARERRLPVSFVTNLIWQESRFDPKSVSHAGAQGIAQFMPSVSKEVGLSNPFDPRQAIPAAAQLLRGLVDKFGNLGLAAAAYNAGPGRVHNFIAKGRRLPAETRNYVSIITGRVIDTWRGLKSQAAGFAVPRGVPCHRLESFAAATRAEEPLPAVATVARRRKPAPSGTTRTAGRKSGAVRVAALKLHERSRRKG